MADKSRFGPELTEAEVDALVADPGVCNKTIILVGLAGYKMITTNSAVIYHFLVNFQLRLLHF